MMSNVSCVIIDKVCQNHNHSDRVHLITWPCNDCTLIELPITYMYMLGLFCTLNELRGEIILDCFVDVSDFLNIYFGNTYELLCPSPNLHTMSVLYHSLVLNHSLLFLT